jgi:streptogramin lyase
LGQALDCSNLPEQFQGNEFPSGDFFSNFQNPCYLIPLPPPGPSFTDLNDTFWKFTYAVNPRYQIILLGNFPNARYFSVAAYDEHSLISQSLLDKDIVPLTPTYVNPYQTGVPYAPGQQYAVAVNFGGTPNAVQAGCRMDGYNVSVNSLDATQRHQGLNWNIDPAFFEPSPPPPFHIVDTPQHTNPTPAGYVQVRAYVDINPADPATAPSIMVRDVASGCAYPAAYVLETLRAVSTEQPSRLDMVQYQTHQTYSQFLPSFCYGTDPRNSVSWSRNREGGAGPNPYSVYLNANLPANLASTLAAAGKVMRLRLRVPSAPPTPCTTGCSRSGNESVRYLSISFDTEGFPGTTFSTVADFNFTQDTNGYATLIVGTGAKIPSWITPASGYTFLDLTSVPDYQGLGSLDLREILPSSTFACSAQNVPYKTTAYTPAGGLMGDYLPVVDYPVAASLPRVASALVGPNSCGVFPVGLPAVSPSCGVVSPNAPAVASVPASLPGEPPIPVQPAPAIAISGKGFGLLPQGLPYTGTSNYLRITDYTQNWSAGYSGSPCNVSISNWADNTIELVANVNEGGPCPLAAGDQMGISVWNPQTMAGPGTATLATAAAPVFASALASNSALVGNAAGSGSVLLVSTGPWTAASNSTWLQLAATSGVGNSLVLYNYIANPSPSPRTGILTIAGSAFTVTQAGASYAPVTSMTTLVASGLNAPQGVAVDAQGNVYIADTGNNAVREWLSTSRKVSALVSSGLRSPTGAAVDQTGNLYIADSGNHAIKEWSIASGRVTSLVSGLANPYGAAVDTQGNVYFSDAGNNVIKEWRAAGHGVITLVGSGLTNPEGVALDAQGNLFFSNTGANAIDEWNADTQQVTTPVSSGISGPSGVALDGQGNIYFADTGDNAIKQWNPVTQQVLTLVSSGLNHPAGVAVDALGNLYVADQGNNAIEEFTFAYLSLSTASLSLGAQAGTGSLNAQILPASAPLTVLSDQPWLTISSVAAGVIQFAFQANTSGASRTANITVLGQQVPVTQSGLAPANLTKTAGDNQSAPTGQVFPVALQVTVTDGNGKPIQGAAVTFAAIAGATGASGTWSSTPPMPILTDQNGNAVAPALTANTVGGPFTVSASVDELSVAFSLTNQVYILGTTSVSVGSAAGKGKVFLTASAPWTATSNTSWLTLAAGSTSGTGSSFIQFSYAANSSPIPQTGTLTVAGLTFTVTQASADYVEVFPVTTLVSTGLNLPGGVAVAPQGNVYIADTGNNAIDEWSPSTQQVTPLAISGLIGPTAVAVDAQSNLYIADSGNHAIRQWNPSVQQALALVAEVTNPYGVAADAQGNVYFSDAGNHAIEEWTAGNMQVTSVVTGPGISDPLGLALDGLGNIYFANAGNDAIEKWNFATQRETVLVPSGINGPSGVAVDEQGNVYFSDSGNNAVKQWNAASQHVVTLVSSGLNHPAGVAVDAQGNVYIADQNNGVIKEITPAYVSFSATSLKEGAAAGSDAVTAQVLPANTPVTASSDRAWLTITTVTSGIVTFAFQSNTSTTSRTAHVTVLGLPVTVTQKGK